MTPKYPEVEVQLSGEDGNGFAIVARVRSALRRAGVPGDECAAFAEEAMSDTYDHLLQTCTKWVTVQ